MKGIVIDAKSLREKEIENLKKEVDKLRETIYRRPKLVIVKATNDLACEAYIRNKVRFGLTVGLEVEVLEFSKECTQEEVKKDLEKLARDKKVDGIILQLPIYNHLDKETLISIIPSSKDADCFSVENLGKIFQGNADILPCTPSGVIDILEHHLVEIEGKNITIIGRGIHTSLTLATILTQKGGIVTVTHSKSKDLEKDISNADIIISCVGKKNLIKPHWIKKNSVILGVGIIFEEGKQYTDYDVKEMIKYSNCSLVGDRVNCTGVATVINLIKNTIKLCKINNKMEGK